MRLTETFLVVAITIFCLIMIGGIFITSGSMNVKLNVVKNYDKEYNNCLDDKQVVQDKLDYCNEIKGVKDSGPGTFLYVITLIVWMGGLAFFVFNAEKSNKLDARQIELNNKEKEIETAILILNKEKKEMQDGRKKK